MKFIVKVLLIAMTFVGVTLATTYYLASRVNKSFYSKEL